MDSDTPTEAEVTLAISISRDRDGFLRLSCESCGRDFKTEVHPSDLESVLTEQVRRVGGPIGPEPEDTGEQRASMLGCPYCAYEASLGEMFTEETVRYIHRFAYRDCMLPLLNKGFAGLAGAFRSPSRSRGLLAISMAIEHRRVPVPVRPIHGPEPADMKIVEFLCCGERIKLSERWNEVTVCPFCGTEVAIA